MRTHSESPGTPRTPTPHLLQVCQRRERRGVTQRHIDHSMMGESAHSGQRRALLPSSLGGRRDKDTDILSVVSASLPLLAGLVPEDSPLGGEVAVTCGNTKEEGIIFLKLVGGDERDGAGLAGCVHLGEDFLGEGLFDPNERRNWSASVLCALRGRQASSDPSHYTWNWNGDPLVNVSLASGGFNAGFLSFGKFRNVAVHGILYQLSQ